MRVDRKARAVALLLGLTLVTAACGDDGGTGDNGDNKTDTGSDVFEGKKGGTLRLKGAGDVDHLDTATAYYTVSYSVLRGLSRQLVSYPTSKKEDVRDVPVADLAEPGEFASSDGLTYTFTIKEGVKWEDKGGTGGRQIVANDVVVGLKRMCDPNNPSGGLVYYQDTITGFTEFCDGFSKAVDLKAPDAARIAAVKKYIESTQISGITTEGERTIKFALKQKAGDFLNILAMPFASPVAPEVALKYVADSPDFRKNFVSSGPYKLTEYVAEKSIKLDRNPQWDSKTDKLRAAWVDKIEVAMGSDAEPVQQELEAGTVDLAWDVPVPTPQIAALKGDPVKGIGGTDQQLHLNPDGCVSYIVMKTNRAPFNNVKVRQAVNYGINRAAIVQIAGGRDVQEPTYNVLTPPILGYKALDNYKAADDKGDQAKAKALLAEAGHTSPLPVTFLYRTAGNHPKYAEAHQESLRQAGFDVKLKGVTPAQFYTEFLQKVNNTEWDFAQPGWCPDWAGNAARTFFSPLLDGRTIKDGSTNYGAYNNKEVNDAIDAALAESDLDKARDLWAALDKKVMDDAVWAPVMTGKVANYRGARVKNWVYFPFSHQADFTNVALDPATP